MIIKAHLTNPLKDSSIDATIDRASREAVSDALELIRNTARAYHRFRSRTGKLEEAIGYELISDFEGQLFVDERLAPYAEWIIRGTGRFGPGHTSIAIHARHERALAWSDEGATRFASRAIISGIKPDSFINEAIEMTEDQVQDYFESIVRASLEEVFE